MKKGIIALGMLATALGGMAQETGTYNPGAADEGVVYYLPKTEIRVIVTATRVNYTPGKFSQYAERYLRLQDVSPVPEEHWEIKEVKVVSAGVPDPENAFSVKLKDKSSLPQMELTPDGIIKAINTTAPAPKPTKETAQAPVKRLDPRSFLTEEVLMSSSSAKMAELVAKEIYSVRESKNSLTRGQADYMPQDGAALKLMLENLNAQEQAMVEMFTGVTDRTDKEFTFRFVPIHNMKDRVAFRMSKKLGVLSSENLAGEPVYLSVTNQEALPPAVDDKGKEKKKKTDGIVYNIPGRALVKVGTADHTYFKGDLPVTQYGATEVLLFSKKITTRVIFDPDTGRILKLDQE